MTENPASSFELPRSVEQCSCGQTACLLHWQSAAGSRYSVRCSCGKQTASYELPILAVTEWKEKRNEAEAEAAK